MKTVPAAVTTAIRQGYNVVCKPRLKAEWNMNRYASPFADNLVAEQDYGYMPELFPIESIYEGYRPNRGAVKARINEAKLSAYSEGSQPVRYYVASVDDLYKYWCSPVASVGTAFPLYNQAFADTYGLTDAGDGRTVVRPFVTYSTPRQANKIVIKLENSAASPAGYQVIIKSAIGDPWQYTAAVGTGPGLISTNPAIDSTGTITLYHQGGGVWNTTAPATTAPLTNVSAIMLKVDSMTVPNSFLNLIEISSRREVDLTDRLITASYDNSMSEHSIIYPMGTINASTASLSLSNIDGLFNSDSTTSTYAGILEPNVKFTLDYIYTIGGTSYVVNEFSNMYGGPWSGQRDETISMDCSDFSKFFQEITPIPTFYENISVSEVVWRLCDQAGFTNYNIVTDPNVAQTRIPIFWADGEQTLWEILDELSRATQTAIYFDSFGVLQVKTRTKAFDTAATPVWTLRGEKAGTELPDIITLEQTDELQTNHVTVTYITSEFTADQNGFPVMERVWEPDDTVALRASAVISTLTSTATKVKLSAPDAAVWPFSGFMQIQGEIIEYDGKEYVYYPSGIAKTVVLKSQDDKVKYDGLTSSRYLNHYTGNLIVKSRGAWNSEAKNHYVEATGYTIVKQVNGKRSVGVGGFVQNPYWSRITLSSTTGVTDAKDYLYAIRGQVIDSYFQRYGTRLLFNAGKTVQRGGIAFDLSSGEDGYYIEVKPTKFVKRTVENEIMLWSRVNGVMKKVGLGVAKAVVEGTMYDLEFSRTTSNVINVYWNGVKVLTETVAPGLRQTANGRFALYLRGQSSLSFEYLYALRSVSREPLDGSTYYDRIQGAYSSTQWDREWVYNLLSTTRRERKIYHSAQKRWNIMFMDEFGPIAHEIRQFDVKFEPVPCLHSNLFNSNERVICTEFYGQPFGATFVLANASRNDTIVSGEEAVGGGNTIEQAMFVFGRAIVTKDEETVIAKNDAQIAARGKVESEISSKWIQSKAAAQAIADWVLAHWSKGADVQTATIFGNPMIELGDVVNVAYLDKSMAIATHVYFVVGIANDFDQGLQTVLTLRRRA